MSDRKQSDNKINKAQDAAQNKKPGSELPAGNAENKATNQSASNDKSSKPSSADAASKSSTQAKATLVLPPKTDTTKSTEVKDPQKSSSSKSDKAKASTETKSTTPSSNEKTSSKAKPAATAASSAKSDKAPVNKAVENVATKQPKPAKTGALWFFTVLNFFLLIGIVGAGYWYWLQLQSEEGEISTSISALDSRLLKSEQDATGLSGETSELRDNQTAITSSIDNLLDEVLLGKQTDEALQKRLSELSGRRPSDWLLAEADYLVNMAGRKLYLENDVRTASTLLSEADSRLEDLNDPALFPVRTLIASDIATLNQINNVSEASVALAVGGLIPQVENLTLRTLTLPEPPAPAETTPSSDIKEWRENLVRAWNDLTDDLVNKTPIDGPIAPYLSESERWLIEQQLKHALSRAQSAALGLQTKVFQQNLLEAVSLIDQHYEREDVSVIQFLGALENLLNTDFSKNYPDDLQAQKALKDVIEDRIDALFNNSGSTL